MPGQLKPIIHGRDHAPDGADPIPGIVTGGAAGSLEGAYLTPGGLEAWWRLGESGTWPTGAISTPNFMADSSGNGHHLTALNRNADATAVLIPTPGDGHLPTLDTAGALTSGDPAINDGGIRFNWNYVQWTSWGQRLALIAPSFFLNELGYCNGPGHGYSLTTWIKYLPTTWPGVINDFAPYASDGSDVDIQPLFGDWSRQGFGLPAHGTRVGFQPFYGYLIYQTTNLPSAGPGTGWWQYKTSYGLVPDQWYFLAMTLERTNPGTTPALYKRRLLLNVNEIASITGDADTCAVSPGGYDALYIGCTWTDDLRLRHSAGGVDEFSVWSRALTDAEIFTQYTVKVETEGDVWTTTNVGAGPAGTPNTVTGDGVPEGIPLIGDGANGTRWGYPKHRVYLNGA